MEEYLIPLKPLVDLAVDNKELIKDVGESAINTFKVDEDMKEIVDSIRKKRHIKSNIEDENKLEHIVNKINKIKMGSGFAIV